MRHLSFIGLLVGLLAFPSAARADVAPPINPPGSNPQPGAEVTQVRMAAETVVIEVQNDLTPGSLGRARVMADFTMRNLGAAEESMAVRFPIGGDDGWVGYVEIENLQVAVNGIRVPYRSASYEDTTSWHGDLVQWAEFDVEFPAGQDVPITVTYDLEGSGYYPYTAFYYILETGAGWKDTIGSADVILRLPYEASPQNVILDLEIGWATTAPGGVFEGNEVRWHFEEFEPGPDRPVQNMEFAIVVPAAWQAVLSARASVERSPADGEAWGMLAKAYKEIFVMGKGYRNDPGGEEIYRLSVDAYEKCLSLKPDDAQWHAGFADLLANRAMWDYWTTGHTPATFRALEEIHTALELAPNDPVVREIALGITFMIDGGIVKDGEDFAFPWLTATPTPRPPTPTMIVIEEWTATLTPGPIFTDTPHLEPTRVDPTPSSPMPVPQQSSPACGSAALVVLAAGMWMVRKQRGKSRPQ